MAVSDLNAVFYSETYHPIQAGSIDGTDTLCHDNAVYRALIAATTGLYDGIGDSKAEGNPYFTVFVGRLSTDTTEATLKEAMSNYGRVKNLRLVRHIVTGASQGYGFVEYETEKEMHHAYEAAHHINIDGCQVLVDYNRQLLMPGWIPRRLGGGLGGCKESGQLRFGGRDRPFRKPLRPIPREELQKLGIPLPPEGHYLSRFEVPPLPKRRSDIGMTRPSKHEVAKTSEEDSHKPEENAFLKEENSSYENTVRRRHHHRHERRKDHGMLVSLEKSHKPSDLEGKMEQGGSEEDDTRQYHYKHERRKPHGKSHAHPGHEEKATHKAEGNSHEGDARRQHHRRHKMREDHRHINDDVRKQSLIGEVTSLEILGDWKQHKSRGPSKAARTPSEHETCHTGDRTQPESPKEVRREEQRRSDTNDGESRVDQRNVNDDVRKYYFPEEGGSSETDDRNHQKRKQEVRRETRRRDADGERRKDNENISDDIRSSTPEEHRNVEEVHDRRHHKGRGSYKAERTSENVSFETVDGMDKMRNREGKDVGDSKRKYAVLEEGRGLEAADERTRHKSRQYSEVERTHEENGSPEEDYRRHWISKQESRREGGIDDDDKHDGEKRTSRKRHREERVSSKSVRYKDADEDKDSTA